MNKTSSFVARCKQSAPLKYILSFLALYVSSWGFALLWIPTVLPHASPEFRYALATVQYRELIVSAFTVLSTSLLCGMLSTVMFFIIAWTFVDFVSVCRQAVIRHRQLRQEQNDRLKSEMYSAAFGGASDES